MDNRLRSIVVGVAHLDDEGTHLEHAAELASAADAVLYVVHAFHVPDPALYPYPEMSLFSPEAVGRVAAGVQERLERLERSVSSGGERVYRAVPAPAEVAVLDVAAEVEADLIIVGPSRRGRLEQAVLGTTAQRIIRGSRIPVLVARQAAPHPWVRVLLTTDLSEVSARAHRHGVQLISAFADPAALELCSLLVVDYNMPLPPPLDETAAAEVAEMKLNGFLQRVSDNPAALEAKVRIGNPSEEIVAEASERSADLLVLGTHGRTGATRFLIGSVAEAVLKAAICDVLVIPNASSAEGS